MTNTLYDNATILLYTAKEFFIHTNFNIIGPFFQKTYSHLIESLRLETYTLEHHTKRSLNHFFWYKNNSATIERLQRWWKMEVIAVVVAVFRLSSFASSSAMANAATQWRKAVKTSGRVLYGVETGSFNKHERRTWIAAFSFIAIPEQIIITSLCTYELCVIL